jgi:hypothetical protein
MATKCGRCHKCGGEIEVVLDGEEYCPKCERYQRPIAHGWSRHYEDFSQCPTILDCILDVCPQDGQFVNHLKCLHCQFNPLGDKQPEFAKQLCQHPQSKHNPNKENWENLKACGVGVLHLLVT